MKNENDLVLIVDDDPDHLYLVERYATSHGLNFKSAKNGHEAIQCLNNNDICMVITDMVMPDIDGMDLLKYTKEHYPKIDVIIMTGYSAHYSYIDVIHAGATDFIVKPFKLHEFSAKIDRAMREKFLLNELRVSKEKAEAANKAKTAFLCTISHELRTPMNGILGFAGLLSKANLPSEEKKFVDLLSQSTVRLQKLINQILDFSAIEAEKTDIKPCHFRLDSVLEDVLFTIQTKADEKNLSLSYTIDDAISSNLFFSDMFALSQILYNLLDNAVKFTESGSIEVLAKETKRLDDDIIEVQFSIKDTGCGITPEKQKLIFEPFTQAEDYMTRKHDGAGLGLAICVKLINAMKGKIWVESKPEKGSTFYFTVHMNAA